MIVDRIGRERPKLIDVVPGILSTGIRFRINGRRYGPLGLLNLDKEGGQYILGVNIATRLGSPITTKDRGQVKWMWFGWICSFRTV